MARFLFLENKNKKGGINLEEKSSAEYIGTFENTRQHQPVRSTETLWIDATGSGDYPITRKIQHTNDYGDGRSNWFSVRKILLQRGAGE